MNSLQANAVLNDLLRILCRSLPSYLADARPWSQAADQPLGAAIERLAADQQRYARHVAEAIVAQGGKPDPGQFAMQFTAKHDLSIEYLRQDVIEQQQRDIAAIEQCAAQLEGIPALHSMAEEILGNARGHLDILKEMMNDEA